jgi:hypothetical protein
VIIITIIYIRHAGQICTIVGVTTTPLAGCVTALMVLLRHRIYVIVLRIDGGAYSVL